MPYFKYECKNTNVPIFLLPSQRWYCNNIVKCIVIWSEWIYGGRNWFKRVVTASWILKLMLKISLKICHCPLIESKRSPWQKIVAINFSHSFVRFHEAQFNWIICCDLVRKDSHSGDEKKTQIERDTRESNRTVTGGCLQYFFPPHRRSSNSICVKLLLISDGLI